MTQNISAIYYNNQLLCSKVKVVRGFWKKLRGLRFYRDFPDEADGLLLYGCKFVSMLGMRFAVDLIYLSQNQQVLYTVEGLVPNKFGPFIADAYYILELKTGVIAAYHIKAGDFMIIKN
ncbi:MAG TPA: hypothetical protein DDW65_15195 [Firmicutes bacterium]|jgi:uncharacterized protein|nr:hypothetical protein [Bacillota bacterium]